MSKFYYASLGAKNKVRIEMDARSSQDEFYQAMNDVCRQAKFRKIPVELWHLGFDNKFTRLTTAYPEFKKIDK